jgi:hypothetical protein
MKAMNFHSAHADLQYSGDFAVTTRLFRSVPTSVQFLYTALPYSNLGGSIVSWP